MEKTLTAQKWESPSRGKNVLPVVAIGVAAAALVIGMNYQFKPDVHATVVAQAPASKSTVNESAPTMPAPDAAGRPGAVGPPMSRAPVASSEPASEGKLRTEPPAASPRLAPRTLAPRALVVPPVPEVRAPRQQEQAPALTPVEPMPSIQASQPLLEPAAPQPVPVPAPLPSTTPSPAGTN